MNTHTCPPDHKHADSSTCFKQHDCHCLPCRAANANRADRSRRHRLYGRPSVRVAADPVREHLHTLRGAGIGLRRVSEVAGVSRTTLQSLMNGRGGTGPRAGEHQRTIGRDLADRILAIPADPTAGSDGTSMPALGTRRRLQALVTAGWSVASLARRIDMETKNLWHVLDQETVTVGMHRRITDLHDALATCPPPERTAHERGSVTRARRYAISHGWEPSLAWDDIDNDPAPAPVDDEHTETDELAIDLWIHDPSTPLNPDDWPAAVQRATTAGWSAAIIAEHLGISDRTVTRIRTRTGDAA